MDVGESQEILQRAMTLRQQSEEIEKQLEFVNEQVRDLGQFSENLETLDKSDEGEIIANLGRGVHMKVSRDKKEKLFVEVGAGTLVRKTPKEALKIIKEQMNKFNEAKVQLTMQLQDHAGQFQEMMKEVEKLKSE